MSAVVLICATLLMSDGDSGRCVTADGERHRVRLAGIDAGEVAPFTRAVSGRMSGPARLSPGPPLRPRPPAPASWPAPAPAARSLTPIGTAATSRSARSGAAIWAPSWSARAWPSARRTSEIHTGTNRTQPGENAGECGDERGER